MNTTYQKAGAISEVINSAQRIVIVQADNPDGDSLASALALEQIIGDMGKEPILYCGVDIPSYLRYLPGWARIQKDLPNQFDASIIVDTSAETLLEKLRETNQLMWLKSRPAIVLDHHEGEQSLPFATVSLNAPAVATGEVIYELANTLDWPLNHEALHLLATSIMADSRGLTTDKTTARSIHIIAELVEKGVSIPELEAARRETMRRPAEIVHYKGRLLQRVEYTEGNHIAVITIPWEEIEQYSHAYNPTMLVIDDMLLTEGAKLAIGFKQYPDGKVTAKIRANFGMPIAGTLAESFGGGGHPYASGFKVKDGRPFNEIKSECIGLATTLIEQYLSKESDEAIQHP